MTLAARWELITIQRIFHDPMRLETITPVVRRDSTESFPIEK